MSSPTRPEFREALSDLTGMGREALAELTEQWRRNAHIRRLKGREPHELPATEAQQPMRETARLRGRPATIAGYTAVAVFTATALLTAPAAGRWRPWAQMEQALGHPIISDNRFAGWLISLASGPLLAVVLWLAAYAFWLGAARDVTVMARHGHRAWPTRIRLAGLTVAGAALTHHLLGEHGGPVHPLIAAGAVLAAWRTLAWATARHAAAVDDLNDYVAHRRVARMDAENAATRTKAQPRTSAETKTTALHPVAD